MSPLVPWLDQLIAVISTGVLKPRKLDRIALEALAQQIAGEVEALELKQIVDTVDVTGINITTRYLEVQDPQNPAAVRFPLYEVPKIFGSMDIRHQVHIPRLKQKLTRILELLRAWRARFEPDGDGHAVEESRGALRKRARATNEIANLDDSTPQIDTNDGKWVRNKLAARLEGVQTRTLSTYRAKGIQNQSATLGRDRDGRVWRRSGNRGSHPWYFKSTLLCSAAKPQNRR